MNENARLFAEYICCEMDEMEFSNETETFRVKDPEGDITLDVTISCEAKFLDWDFEEWHELVPIYCDQVKVVRGDVDAEPIRKSVNELLELINQN